MAVRTQAVTGGTNHGAVQNLRGWSLRGTTLVVRLRKAVVGGAILATIAGDSHELFPDAIDAEGGTYVEVVSGTLTEGVLYHV